MSKAFAQKFGHKKVKREEIRKFTDFNTPLGDDGRPIYVTEQGHKDECDVNNIIKKYDQTGLITHVANFEASYGDVKSMDFREAMELQLQIRDKFSELPSNIRKEFDNNPEKYLAFLENPKNDAKAIEMGLRKETPQYTTINAEPSKQQKASQDTPK
ncbi:MAG: internal scaffolding protein [Arizlama microvirus]|nr:MAG: internal scaffolding protein [Arizlama microvirus]